MENYKRDFKGVWFPKELWLDNRLNMLEKGICAEIDSLDDGEEGCYASNEYLAEFCGCSERKVSDAISKLVKLGYIYIKSFDGRTRYLRSRLTNDARQSSRICEAEMQSLRESNIEDKHSIDKENNIKEKSDDCLKALEYLNEKAGTRYRAVESNLKFIRGRLKDYTLDDLKSVVDKKVAEWKGTAYQQYLRPETLFNATKFETYLNGLAVKKENKFGYEFGSHTQEEFKSIITNPFDISIDDI